MVIILKYFVKDDSEILCLFILGVGEVQSSVTLTSVATVSSVPQATSGIYGGSLLTIYGNGFSSLITDIQVTVDANICIMAQTAPSQIQCIIPAQESSTSPATIHIVSNGVVFPNTLTLTYSSAITPTVTSINPTSGSAGETLTISGSTFVDNETNVSIGDSSCTIISISSTSITCTIGSSPAGNQSVVVCVQSVGKSNSNIQFQYNLQVNSVSPSQGSYGGGQTISIIGDGFDGSNVVVTVCSQACQSIIIVSNTQLTCITPSATISSSDTTCSLIVNVGGLIESVSYLYEANLTATITSISPNRGGTGGGTTLTITGTGFP